MVRKTEGSLALIFISKMMKMVMNNTLALELIMMVSAFIFISICSIKKRQLFGLVYKNKRVNQNT